MIAFPFQSNFRGFDEHGNPIYDRAVDATFYRQRESLFYTNGVFVEPATNFQVVAHSGMTVRVKPGRCFVQGVTAIEVESTDITLDNADELTARTDIIVLRADFTENRSLTVELKKGTEELRRDSDVWELQIAKITVPRLASAIRQQDITDTRLNANLCGIVASNIGGFDTTALFNQIEDYIVTKKAELNEQTDSQQREWQEQTQAQQAQYTALVQTIDDWYNSIRTDIAVRQFFLFEFISNLKGVRKKTEFRPDGSLYQSIKKLAGLAMVAEQTTTFETNGDIVKNLKIYQEDGETILDDTTITIRFLADGSIEEDVQ